MNAVWAASRPGEFHEQMMRELGHREDVDEVEEQLEEGGALLALPMATDYRQRRDDLASGRAPRREHTFLADDRELRLAEHEQLVKLVRAGDKAGASELLKKHLDDAERLLVAAVAG